MLLRAGLIYVLTVLTMLLGGLAAWQNFDISVRSKSAEALTQRITALQSSLEEAGRREDAAVRRARVAEDSLSRNESYNSSDVIQLNEVRDKLAIAIRDKAVAEAGRISLETELAQAIKERDQIRLERDDLERAADAARVAADKALQEADTAHQEIVDLKKAAATPQTTVLPAATVTTEAVVVSPVAPKSDVSAAQVTASEVKVVSDELVRPAAETATVKDGDTKATLSPSAVTIVPAPKAEKQAPPKRITVKSEPRRPAASKSASVRSNAVKKAPPKQAKKEDQFFPF